MSKHFTRIAASATVITTLGLAALAPVSQAASAGDTVTVKAAHAYVDNQRPGVVVSGTLFKGDKLKIKRVKTVTSGSAKGRWYFGTARVTGEHAKNSKGEIHPFTLTGWVKASAFSS